MKGAHLLTIGDHVFVFKHLHSEKVSVLFSEQARLDPWREDIQATFTQLRTLPQGIDGANANPDDLAGVDSSAAGSVTQGQVSLHDLDRTTEGSVRVTRLGVQVGADQARGRRDAEDEARWRAAEVALFPAGLKFLQSSLAEQVGETERLLARAESAEVAWLHKRWSVHGQTFAEALAQVRANNEALNAALTADAPPATRAAVSVAELRRGAQRLLSDLLPVIERVFPVGSPQRKTILDPLQKRVDFRVRKQAEEKKQAATASDKTPTDAPANTSTAQSDASNSGEGSA